MKTIYATFRDTDDADKALRDLSDIGYSKDNVSILVKDNNQLRTNNNSTFDNAASGAVKGGAVGGLVGGLAGLLIGIGVITIPGIGGLLIGGPLAAALGLSGVAATTVSGATTGALAGGLVGAFRNLGIPENIATNYEKRINEGSALLGIEVKNNEDEMEIKNLFKRYGGEDITVVTTP